MQKYPLLFAFLCMMLITLFGQSISASAESCSARSAIVIDRKSKKILYSQNAYERLPMASTTKIMSALIVLESGNLDEEFVVDSNAIKVEGSSMGLKEGSRVTLRKLVFGMLLPSGNDAANAAAVRVAGSQESFVDMMNKKAEELGLENTHFVTPSGLDDYTDDHYSTAYDMALLADAALQNNDFADICSQKYIKTDFGEGTQEFWLRNTNRLLESCDGVFGVKTGFTDKAKRCLVSSCRRNGAELICVTLNDSNDWDDHSRLYDSCFDMMKPVKLSGGQEKFTLKVAGGRKKLCEAVSEPVYVQLPDDAEEHLNSVICIKPFVFAPACEGEEVGYVSYYYDDRLICTQPIILNENIHSAPLRSSGWESLLAQFREAVGE